MVGTNYCGFLETYSIEGILERVEAMESGDSIGSLMYPGSTLLSGVLLPDCVA
jgi:hypothetical protein